MKVALKRMAIFAIWPVTVGLLGAIFPISFTPYMVFAIITGAFWGVIMSLMVWPRIT